jgi:hypothetical protein
MSDTNKSAAFISAFIFYKNTNHFLSIKYDRVLKLKRTDSYRGWRDMLEVLLEILELWDIITKKKQSSIDENDKQDFVDRERNYILFLFQTVDVTLLLILSANKKSHKIWAAFEQKFDMKTIETFLA